MNTPDTTSDMLTLDISAAMEKIDPCMNIEDFATSVADILAIEFGRHNYEKFLLKLIFELEGGAE